MTGLALLLETNNNLAANCLDEPFLNDVCRYEYWDIWARNILENLIEIDKMGNETKGATK